MYSVRLLLRSFAREAPGLKCRLRHSGKIKTKPKAVRSFPHKGDPMAGIRNQAKAMNFTPDDMAELEDLEDDEMNMSRAEQVYDSHFSEINQNKNKRALAEYGQKFYRHPKEPPLLSIDDMKQIRRLHSEEKWPVSILAKSFPASEIIITKVIKSTWKPSLEDEFRHDEKVAQNWLLLRKGQLEISDELKQHCLKFTNRVRRPMTSKDCAVLNAKPERPPGSFLNLIKPPENVKSNTKPNQSKEDQTDGEEVRVLESDYSKFDYSNNNVLQHLRDRITLEELRKRELEKIADQGTSVNEDEKAFVCGTGSSESVLPDDSKEGQSIYNNAHVEQSVATKQKSNEFISKWDSSGKSIKATKDAMMAPIVHIPEQIKIPETAKKPGAIYRVEDCFYNEDGEFLYRVPGLKL